MSTSPDNPSNVTRLRDVSGTQWKSGLAAWLGWFFDGLDMHLYTLVAAPFVAELCTFRPPPIPVLDAMPPSFKPPSWSVGRSAADSSGESAIESDAVAPCA